MTSTYAQAVSELTVIRDRLASGEVPIDDIEDLAERARRAVAVAQAVLRRHGESIERLGSVVSNDAVPAT